MSLLLVRHGAPSQARISQRPLRIIRCYPLRTPRIMFRCSKPIVARVDNLCNKLSGMAFVVERLEAAVP